jgi:hypothetical protein
MENSFHLLSSVPLRTFRIWSIMAPKRSIISHPLSMKYTKPTSQTPLAQAFESIIAIRLDQPILKLASAHVSCSLSWRSFCG